MMNVDIGQNCAKKWSLNSQAYSHSGALAAACQDHQENQQALRKEGILRVLLGICNSETSAERMRDKATAIMISIVGQPGIGDNL